MGIDDFLLLLSPIGICVMVGVGVAYVVCTYFPPAHDCASLGGWIIGLSFIVGFIFSIPSMKKGGKDDN